jgi:dynein heavy chain
LMRALRDMNKPKFIYEDMPLFIGLIKDLFPTLQVEGRVGMEDLKADIVKYFEEKKLSKMEEQMDKVIQLYETLNTRHTTMVVGPTCGGKTVIIDALAGANLLGGHPTK